MVRKLIGAVAALSLVVLIAGCGGQATTTSDGTTTTAGTATTTDSPATTTATTAPTTSTQTPSSTTSTSTSSASSTTPTTSAQTPSRSQTSTASTSNCGGDCQPTGTPAVPGSKAPVNGKCSAGYTYLPPQDGGPALCIPQDTGATTSTSSTN